MSHLETLLTATPAAGVLIEELVWNAAVGVVAILAIVGVVRLPTARWAHGGWSKAAWIAAVLWVNWRVGGIVIPLGTIAAIWHTRALANAEGGDARPADNVPVAKATDDRPKEGR